MEFLYRSLYRAWHFEQDPLAPSMSPALAFAAPSAAIEAQLPIPGGGLAAMYESALAIRSESPLDVAGPMTPRIQPCMGQFFWPLPPHS